MHNEQSYYPPATTNVQMEHTEANPDSRDKIFSFVFNQMTAKAGIKKHGKAALIAMMEEYAQMENLNVYHEIDPKTLKTEQKRCFANDTSLQRKTRWLSDRTCPCRWQGSKNFV